jgi:hypothetical protein
MKVEWTKFVDKLPQENDVIIIYAHYTGIDIGRLS